MLTLFTSGSTDEPKLVTHSWAYIDECAKTSIKEIGLTSNDRVLDVFPGNTIAHYTVTAYPARLAGASLTCANFSPYSYCELFNQIKPTYISLIPKHFELLSASKAFKELDMSSVKYMVTGSSKITQEFIDAFLSKGVQKIGNWYGMTEFPPPVFVGYNSISFDLETIDTDRFHVMFMPVSGIESKISMCYINGVATGDLFNMETKTFHSRIKDANGKTWKTTV